MQIRETLDSQVTPPPTNGKEVPRIKNPSHGLNLARSIDKRQGLISLLRGFFACPVIAALGDMGVADVMMQGEFSLDELGALTNRPKTSAILRYLQSIGMIACIGPDRYALTAEGVTAIGRNGAFSLITSYGDYFRELPQLLAGEDVHPTVNRLQNVRGSGQLHSRKFFPRAFELLSTDPPTSLIDIGCGDGCFLAHAREKWPHLSLFGVDLSRTAVDATKHRLNGPLREDTEAVIADGYDVALWAKSVPDSFKNSSSLILSLWFVAHEFSMRRPERIVDFFSLLHAAFPSARVVLGEITRISSEMLAEDHALSIMPEFLLFHELSGQGVLDWSEWHDILERIPYSLACEARFDEVRSSTGRQEPASFIWLLKPEP